MQWQVKKLLAIQSPAGALMQPPKGSNFYKESSHKDRNTIPGGTHERGLAYRNLHLKAGRREMKTLIKIGAVISETSFKGVRLTIKKEFPTTKWGIEGELGIRRCHHFLRDIDGIWLEPHELEQQFKDVYDNLVNVYKN